MAEPGPISANYTGSCKWTSENAPSETFWKIAEGLWRALLRRQESADRDSFDPSWALSEPPFLAQSEFPNSLYARSGEYVHKERPERMALAQMFASETNSPFRY